MRGKIFKRILTHIHRNKCNVIDTSQSDALKHVSCKNGNNGINSLYAGYSKVFSIQYEL